VASIAEDNSDFWGENSCML